MSALKSRIEVVPAVMPQSLLDIERGFAPLVGVVRGVQVDVVDGKYAHGFLHSLKTWPYRDRASFERVVQEERGLPHWESFDYEFDLMIQNPAVEAMAYVHAGATRIIVHASSPGATEAVQSLVELREEGGAFSIQVGVALGAHASPEDLEAFEAQYDFVQVMGIEREGRQGEPFDPDKRALFLVERLRKRYALLPIQVDGGVNKETVPALVTAGATRLVAGSAIVKAADPAAAYRELAALANGGATQP